MPTLDFSDVIASPEFTSLFNVRRRSDSVDPATGRSVPSTAAMFTGISGVVVYGGGEKNSRREDAQSTDRQLTIVTKFRLRAASASVQPDVVIYDGVEFTVIAVEHWHRFGSGFVKATAESMNAFDIPIV